VQRNNDGKPQFIHRTFAEYFVAECLIEGMTKEINNVLIERVLLRKDYKVTRIFLNGLLEKSKPSTLVLREYGVKLNDQWGQREVHQTLEGVTTELHTAAVEDNAHIVGFLLESLKSGKHSNATQKMLLAKDDMGRTACHMAAEKNSVQALKKIREWAEAVTPTITYSLLLPQDIYGRTAWQLAAQKGHIMVVEKLWCWANELQLKQEEIRNKVVLSKNRFEQTAWHIAAINGHVEVLEKLWGWSKEVQLKPEELRNELLLSKFGHKKTVWQTAAKEGYIEVLQKLWDWAKELQLKPEELRNEMLLSKDNHDETAWHKAATTGHVEVLEKLWDLAKELQLKPEELRNEVLSKSW
jgi:ankyrin repeat protein